MSINEPDDLKNPNKEANNQNANDGDKNHPKFDFGQNRDSDDMPISIDEV
ncbi:MAG: hypothetical protein PHS49_07885 [Candidatus Gracilibacteria bacterium]|nr:hypothetical protein [Candidatus Gracilibacteria bacterium]